MLFIFLFLIFWRPFICSPGFPTANLIHSAALFLLLLIWIIPQYRVLIRIRFYVVYLALFLSTIALSVFCTRITPSSIPALANILNGALAFIIAALLTPKEKLLLIKTLVLSSLCVAIAGIHQYFFGFQNLINYLATTSAVDPAVLSTIQQKRIYYPFITANALGGYLAMLMPIALGLRKWEWIAVLLLFALLLTKSIGAMATLVLTLLIFFALKKKLTRKEYMALIFFFSILLFILALRLHTFEAVFQPFFSSERRIAYWQETWSVIQLNFWTGTGPGNFDLLLSRYSHNSFLQLWAETGLFSLIGFLLLIGIILRQGIVALKKAVDIPLQKGLICAAFAFLIHNMIDFTFFIPEVSLLWWVILGLLINPDLALERSGINRKNEEQKPSAST